MPQDSLRSFVYRSFVTCDDPNGVVECKTTRKSKIEGKRMEGKAENVKSVKNLAIAPLHKEETSIDELDKPSSIQLKEVSRGAEKLSKVVDSLSKGSFNRQSEDIAKDLLIGAQNLQESLLMLGKLQEASKYMENLKKKPKEMFHNQKVLQRSYSERFGDHTKVIEFQKPRLSADGSSRDCYEELREVIRESFARNNLLPKSVSEKKVSLINKKELSPDIATASSSQSSMFHSYEVASTDSSSSNLQLKKPRDSNLIAKLMGLEEIPSKPMKSTLRDHLEKGNILNNKRPIFDIDFPNAKKPSFFVQKVKPEQRTLGEIIEIMEFKGLMKRKSFEGSKPHMCASNFSESSDFADDATPFVLMKPLLSSSLTKESFTINKCSCGRIASETENMLRLWKIKDGLSLEKKIPQKRVLNSTDIERRVRTEKNAVKRISHEKAAKNFTRPSLKDSKVEDNPSSTRKSSSSPVSFKTQKEEAIKKTVNKIQRMAPSMRNAAERNQFTEVNSRRSHVSKPNNQGKNNTTKVTNSRGSNVLKNDVAKPKCITSDPIPKNRTNMVLHNYGNRKKKIKDDKLAEKKSAAFVENITHGNVGVENNLKFENRDDILETKITPAEHLSCEELQDASDDNCIPRESTALIIQQTCNVISEETNNSIVDHDLIENGIWKTRTSVRDVLLTSASFMSRAKEFFNTISDQPMVFEETSTHDYGVADAKLILDYANELLECKFLQWSKFSVSFDLLVAGIRNGIENLKAYSKLGGETILGDTLYTVLERDLWGKGVITGTWDLGWKNGFTSHEVEEVVFDIEEFLLSGIIEDLLLDFSK